MYGKAFESQYKGSMMGAGMNVFAVWGYIIANTHYGVIEINPKLLSFVLGGTEKEVVSALEYLMAPDKGSRSKEEHGRRIVKDGEYQYRVVNWAYYQGMKDAIGQREYNRERMRIWRAKKNGKPLPGEVGYCKQVEVHGPEPQAAGEKWPVEAGVETAVKPEGEDEHVS